MNYYTIPKNNCVIQLRPIFSPEIKPVISHSFLYYLDNMQKQISGIPLADIEYIKQNVNPLEFVHTPVPLSSFSVSKIKAESNIFYELMELFQVCGLMDFITEPLKYTIGHIGPNNISTGYLMDMLREDKDDNIISMDFEQTLIVETLLQHNDNNPLSNKFDILVMEWCESDYNDIRANIRNLVMALMVASKTQNTKGLAVVKIDNLFYKPILDIIFIFSSLYDKVTIVKPTNSSILKGERYLVCKGFCENINIENITGINNQIDDAFIRAVCNKEIGLITSIMDQDLPYYFVNRIEEPNAIIGQQQLEAYDHVVNIYKNKNKDEKLETLKRNHIQKCIQWCEKNQIPHNKFPEKVNIFLLPKKRELDQLSSSPSTSASSGSEEDN